MSSVYSVPGMTCDHCRAAVESHVAVEAGYGVA